MLTSGSTEKPKFGGVICLGWKGPVYIYSRERQEKNQTAFVVSISSCTSSQAVLSDLSQDVRVIARFQRNLPSANSSGKQRVALVTREGQSMWKKAVKKRVGKSVENKKYVYARRNKDLWLAQHFNKLNLRIARLFLDQLPSFATRTQLDVSLTLNLALKTKIFLS